MVFICFCLSRSDVGALFVLGGHSLNKYCVAVYVFLSVTLRRRCTFVLGGHSLNKYCVAVYVFDSVFIVFLRKRLPFQKH